MCGVKKYGVCLMPARSFSVSFFMVKNETMPLVITICECVARSRFVCVAEAAAAGGGRVCSEQRMVGTSFDIIRL